MILIKVNTEEDIMSILKQIENLCLSSPKIPIFNRVLVNEDELFELVELLKNHLPKEIDEAKQLVENKAKLVDSANKKAKEIITKAQKEASLLTSEHEIVKESMMAADKIRSEFDKELEQRQEEADKYADEVLESLETSVLKTLTIIKNGKEKLGQYTQRT